MPFHDREPAIEVRGGESARVFANEIDISRPPAFVWPYLVDWERLGEWMLEASDFRLLTDVREGVGVEAEARIRLGPIATRDRVRVTRWEPPWVLEMAHLGWVKGTGYIELAPTEGGTHVFWREELHPPWGPIGALGFRLFAPALRRTFVRDLQVLKELVEARR